jgi:WD40 repeat protein
LTELPRHRDALLCGAVSPCGTRLLTGGRDGVARLSDATTGATIVTWAADGGQAPCADGGPAAERPIYSCAFFPSGSHVLLAGAAGGRIWQLPEMERLGKPMRTERVQ